MTKPLPPEKRKIRGKNLAGAEHFMLTAVERIGSTDKGDVIWRCRCECGKEDVRVLARCFGAKWGPKSCGCYSYRGIRNKVIGKRRRRSYVGKEYGLLTVISELPDKRRGGRNVRVLLCRCRCGKETAATLPALENGRKTTCGTWCEPAKERRRERLRIFAEYYREQRRGRTARHRMVGSIPT